MLSYYLTWGAFTLVVQLSWSFWSEPKKKLIYLIPVHLAFTLSFLTTSVKTQDKTHKHTMRSQPDWSTFMTFITKHPKLLCSRLNSLILYVYMWYFYLADNSQRAYKICKGVKTASEVWMAAFTLIQMSHTNWAIKLLLIKLNLPSVNTPLTNTPAVSADINKSTDLSHALKRSHTKE